MVKMRKGIELLSVANLSVDEMLVKVTLRPDS